MNQELPKVALLIETSRGYGRAMLRGIVRYARLHGPWRFHLTPGDFAQALPQMKQWSGTGIIARIESASMAKAILAAELPTIGLDISQNVPLDDVDMDGVSEITSGSSSASRMAAEHLLDCGFNSFAYVGEPDRIWSRNREEAFCERIREAGGETIVYPMPRSKRDRSWEREQTILTKWLKELPKPIGVMACNDDRGRQVLDACRAAEISVPLEVAVIGVDNDDLLCELADPPLTSVELNSDAGGYRAAALLDGMMKGKVVSARRLVVEPTRVVERRSTQVSAVRDPDVAAALQFIQYHAAENIGVDDVVKQLHMSRRAFELRFREVVGRTPYHELRRVRIQRAQQLLLETDLPISQVATASGFSSAAYLAQVFQKQLGKTPAQFRNEHRT